MAAEVACVTARNKPARKVFISKCIVNCVTAADLVMVKQGKDGGERRVEVCVCPMQVDEDDAKV